MFLYCCFVVVMLSTTSSVFVFVDAQMMTESPTIAPVGTGDASPVMFTGSDVEGDNADATTSTGGDDGNGTTGTNDDNDAICVSESTALNLNNDVASATQSLLTTTKDDVLANFTSYCSIFSRKCTIDLAQYSSELQQACSSASVTVDGSSSGTTSGGQFYEQQIVINCRTNTAAPDSIEIPGSVVLDNLPSCIGTSCDPNNLPTMLTQILDDVLMTLTDEINAALGESIVCQPGDPSSSSSTTAADAQIRNTLLLLLVTVIVVVMTTQLL